MRLMKALRIVGLGAAGLSVVVLGLAVTTDGESRAFAAPPTARSTEHPTTTTVTAPMPSIATVVDTSSTTTMPPPPPRLPLPAALPEDAYAEDPDEPIGRIVIPAIGLDSQLGEGMTLTEIDRGPAHWPGTAMPGALGNVVVAGHRTTRSSPFRHIDALEEGDEIRFQVGERVAVYLVTDSFVVEPTDVWIAQQTPSRMVTLFACHPLGSAAQRIVVRGELVPTSMEPTAR